MIVLVSLIVLLRQLLSDFAVLISSHGASHSLPSARMRRRVTSCVCVGLCLSVIYHSSANIARFYTQTRYVGVRLFSLFNVWNFCSEVMAKANMQISMYFRDWF